MSAQANVNEDIILIPFIKARKLITVEAIINGEKRTFLLDTGAADIVLNTKYIDVDNEPDWKPVSVLSVNGMVAGMGTLTLKAFDFYGIHIKSKEVLATDISHLEGVLKTELYGIIGYDVIKDFDVLFDYENQVIALINPDKTPGYLTTTLKGALITEVPVSMHAHIAAVEANVAGKILHLGVDSGAEGNLIDITLFNSMEAAMANLQSKSLMGGDGIANTAQRGILSSMLIGDKIFKDTPTVFSNISHINNELTEKIDGLIGHGILSTQKVILSYQNKKLIFIE